MIANVTSTININISIITIYKTSFTNTCNVPKNKEETLSISAVNLV